MSEFGANNHSRVGNASDKEYHQSGHVREYQHQHDQKDPHTEGDSLGIEEEARLLSETLRHFRLYADEAMLRLERDKRVWRSLNMPEVISMLPKLEEKWQAFRDCAFANQEFFDSVIELGSRLVSNEMQPFIAKFDKQPEPLNAGTMAKVHSILRQAMREWSSVGKQERTECFSPILSALERTYPDEAQRKETKVIMPGCGLGRIVCEVAGLGFDAVGNEFSYPMLLAGNCILNGRRTDNQPFKLHPFLSQGANLLQQSDQFVEALVPDIDPSLVAGGKGRISMIAGDFFDTFDSSWFGAVDVVVTCFFIDTTFNIIHCVERISHLLKEGGKWINLGPLLYHTSEADASRPIVQLSWEELRDTFGNFNLQLQEERTDIKAHYAEHPQTMLKSEYSCVFSVCEKVSC